MSASRIRSRLLAWYDHHQRDLPWRRTRDPYAIWVSETMLQQTQVATVISYYERFMDRFPTVRALAAARLGEVLRLWAGLGYYARARNLHRTARRIRDQFAGELPDNIEDLRALPGVGQYTAGAIASIAFDRRAAVVDGNVARVLARLVNLREDVSNAAVRDKVWRLAESLLPRRQCGDFNQAMMELGATICLPGAAARCESCPLRGQCAALASGSVAKLPVKKNRTRVLRERHVVAAIQRAGRFLVVRRPAEGLWGGLWELPSVVVDGRPPVETVRQIGRRWMGSTCRVTKAPFCRVVRQLTHRRIEFVGHVCRIGPSGHAPDSDDGQPRKWATLEQIERLGISRAMRDVVDELRRVVLKRGK